MTTSPWQDTIERAYYDHIGTLPLILDGTDPNADVRTVNQVGPGRIYWFTYAIAAYDAHYWALFQVMYARSGHRTIHVTTALALSEQIMGPMVFDLDIPDVWIISMEEHADSGQSRLVR